jgi:hypothetical protein
LPSSGESRPEIDFVTALGCLLQSGPRREAFALYAMATARELGVAENDRAAFLRLVPEELEVQAAVLLRKRLDQVRRALPRTCRSLGQETWEEFQRYGRLTWPPEKMRVAEDAFGFCRHLLRQRAEVVCRMEFHRVRFARGSRRWEIRFVRSVSGGREFKPGAQVFFRRGASRWREWLVFPGL